MPRGEKFETYGVLTVLTDWGYALQTNGKKPKTVLCLCECGELKVIIAAWAGKAQKSCGCLRRRGYNAKHGDSGTPEYGAWYSAFKRCFNPKNPYYYRYGGRGITMCQRWKDSYENFLADMGRKPTKKHSLDRINNDGNYEPGNCRWATHKQQTANKTHPLLRPGYKPQVI